MTKDELEKEVRLLRRELDRLRYEQDADILRFQELEVIKQLYEEAAIHLRALNNIGKWTLKIVTGITAVAIWIKRSAIWAWLNQ